ncbi:MAG TPA: 4-(cytidine 5'-diphospho)-2-C-methyl-D-erythritol kinase [Clostridiales bacterium]|nr:4-(cytidine 5'-diphospho)-2-C-methyl-D-erythritol kinase [Clostridiales bacterium]
MGKVVLKAPGKINWTLDVMEKRPDGYHEVEMLMQSISLWDDVVLTECSEGVKVTGNTEEMPLNENNLAAKAARLIINKFGIEKGVHIDINKRIPIAAGLAGGSTNAAAVLVGLNVLWDLKLPVSRLAELGVELGADVPFCIYGGTAEARGIGEKLTHLPPIEGIWLVLVKPPFGISTAWAYRELKIDKVVSHPDIKMAYTVLRSGEWEELSRYLGNVLESVARGSYPEINDIKEALLKAGAKASMMTGSGPTVYGIFQNKADAMKAADEIKKSYSQVHVVSTRTRGVEIAEGGNL